MNKLFARLRIFTICASLPVLTSCTKPSETEDWIAVQQGGAQVLRELLQGLETREQVIDSLGNPCSVQGVRSMRYIFGPDAQEDCVAVTIFFSKSGDLERWSIASMQVIE